MALKCIAMHACSKISWSMRALSHFLFAVITIITYRFVCSEISKLFKIAFFHREFHRIFKVFSCF